MKKNMIFAAMSSLAVMFAVSCTKETPVTTPEGAQVEPGFKEVSLTAGVPTKVNSLDATIRWNTAAEKLAVFGQLGDAMLKYQFTKPEAEGVKTPVEAVFTGTVSENATLKYASYPYNSDDELSSCTVDGVLSMNLDNTPSYNATNSIPNETPLYAVISGESVTMKSACAYFQITLPGSAAVFQSVKVTSEQNIAGTFTVDCRGDVPVISGGSENTITAKPRRNNPGYIYIPIIPGTYDDIAITVEYNDGYPAFVKQSASSNTFEAGKFYPCKEVSGARVESVTTGNCAFEGTSLTMNASAVVWKYSGITNDAYSAKIFYAEQGVEKGAAGWNEVEATISGDEGNNVTLSATATVESGKSYQYYAQISDGTKEVESEVVAAVAKERKSVAFSFKGEGETFEYLTLKAGSNTGYRKIVDVSGNEVFPSFSPSSNRADYYYKEWDGSAWSDIKEVVDGSAGNIAGMVGGTITKSVDGHEYSVTIVSTKKYYTYTSKKLCVESGFSIKLNCPSGYTITNVRLQTAKGDNCVWGLGVSAGVAGLVAAEDFEDANAPVDVNIAVPSPEIDTSYYLVSDVKSNRLMSVEITYEK